MTSWRDVLGTHADGWCAHTVHVGLLFILVDVVYPVLSKSVELPRVVEYTMVPLLQAQELLQLAVEKTHR
jgi:hypothetical protein